MASVESSLKQARALGLRGDIAGAVSLFSDILTRAPLNRAALEGLVALVLPGTGKPDAVMAGAQLLGRGQRREARILAEALVRQRPRAPRAHQFLSSVLTALGEPAAAVKAGRKAVALQPEDPYGHYNLGVALSAQGDHDGAIAAYEETLRLAPDNSEARFNLGIAQQSAGDPAAAAQSYRRALAGLPGYAPGYLNLGNALREAGDLTGAIEAYRTALRKRPGLTQAHVNLASVLREAGDLTGAIASASAAVKAEPQDVTAHNNLGLALQGAEDHDAAIKAFEAALSVAPASPDIPLHLARSLRATGDLAAARSVLEDALTRNPANAAVHESLSQIKRFSAEDPQIATVEALLADPALPARDCRMLEFTLAKACDDLGQTDAAFAHLVTANRLRRDEIGYDIATDRARVERIKTLFATPPAPPAVRATTGPRPVLVLGMPRSGTTLVEQILSSHSQVHGAGELADLTRAAMAALETAAPTSVEVLKDLHDSYVAGLAAHSADAPVVIDKMPLNFMWIGFVLTLLPDARVIHLRRDARAICWSIFRHDFATDAIGYGYDLDDLAAYYALYDDLMRFWDTVYPGRIQTLHYEALTEDQEGETRRLLAAAGLEWEPGCLDFHKTARAVGTASAEQVRQPIYRGSSNDWRRYERQLAPLVAALQGY